MNHLPEPPATLSPSRASPAESQEAVSPHDCEYCGRPEAHLFSGHCICDACYIAKGSCCAGDE